MHHHDVTNVGLQDDWKLYQPIARKHFSASIIISLFLTQTQKLDDQKIRNTAYGDTIYSP